jgi:hypothetical protein
MTAKRRLEENGIKGGLIVILFLFLSLKLCVVKGEAMTFHSQEYGCVADRYLLADSARGNSRKTDKPLYLGYELALGKPIYTLNSDLAELNRLRVNNLGVTAGGVVANKFGKLKGKAGLFYSDILMPHFRTPSTCLSASCLPMRIC